MSVSVFSLNGLDVTTDIDWVQHAAACVLFTLLTNAAAPRSRGIIREKMMMAVDTVHFNHRAVFSAYISINNTYISVIRL